MNSGSALLLEFTLAMQIIHSCRRSQKNAKYMRAPMNQTCYFHVFPNQVSPWTCCAVRVCWGWTRPPAAVSSTRTISCLSRWRRSAMRSDQSAAARLRYDAWRERESRGETAWHAEKLEQMLCVIGCECSLCVCLCFSKKSMRMCSVWLCLPSCCV